jgi:hypothetical protein
MRDQGPPFSVGEADDLGRAFRPLLRAAIVATIAFFGLLFALGVVRPYVEWLWFAHDVRRPGIFTTILTARGQLFTAAFLVAVPLLYFNWKRALGLTLVYLREPENSGQILVSQLLGWVVRRGGMFIRWFAPAVAAMLALGVSSGWQELLLAQNAQSFGRPDPAFGLDLGFFVFWLPLLKSIMGFLVGLFLTAAVGTLAIYFGLTAMASVARIELDRPQVKRHLTLLASLGFAVLAAAVALNALDVGYLDSAQFTGAGNAANIGYRVQVVVAGLLMAAAIGCLIALRGRRPLEWAGRLALVPAAVWLLGVAVWPAIWQRFVVEPDRLNREAPFADRALKMTRFGYGLEGIEQREMRVSSGERPAANSPTLANMRLWDPEVMRQALDGLQTFRSYYSFHDVDIDRYVIDGKPTMVMLAPRDVFVDGLAPNAQNWANQRLRFTHGYGVAISRVDRASPAGEPFFLARDVPEVNNGAIPITRPQLYFSDFRDALGRYDDPWVLVRTNERELDYETTESTVGHRFESDRGIPVSPFFSRLALSLLLGDRNLLFSANVTAETRLLRRRNISERAGAVFPFLRFDRDPYIVIREGRPIWILDGYTVSDMVPYSARFSGPTGSLNYIRNSVKVTVDAYTGEVNAYAIDDEPVLRAWRRAFPGLIQDRDAIPAGLDSHFRYAEDLMLLQSEVLSTYHVRNAEAFLSNSDAWNVAIERGISGVTAPIRPYYVIMTLPGETQSGFFLIRPFTPTGKPNMSAWLAGHCDPERLGQLTLYRFVGEFPPGPELMENKFNGNAEIANINRQFNNEQSEIVVGNLLVMPLGRSVLYAESLFLRSRTSGLQATPRLTKVILSLDDRIVVRDTYQEALAALLGVSAALAPEARPGAPTPRSDTPESQLDQVRQLLEQSDAALRAGDLAKFGELFKRLREAAGER